MRELVVRDHALGHVSSEPGDRDRDARSCRADHARLHREGERAAAASSPSTVARRLALRRSGRAPSRARTRASSTSPGSTMRLKRTAVDPREERRSCPGSPPAESTATAPPGPSPRRHDAGHDRAAGEMAREPRPSAVTVLRATTRLPGSSSTTSSIEQKRIAVREDRLDLRPARRAAALMPRHRARGVAQAVAAPVRVALRRPDRHPRPAEISANEKPSASLSTIDLRLLEAAARRARRRAPRAARRFSAASAGSSSGGQTQVLGERLAAAAHACARRRRGRC